MSQSSSSDDPVKPIRVVIHRDVRVTREQAELLVAEMRKAARQLVLQPRTKRGSGTVAEPTIEE